MDNKLPRHVALLVDTEAYFRNETCLLVFLKSCTVTLKHNAPAHLYGVSLALCTPWL